MDRSSYQRLVQELPFQHIADTPTVKYYTDWRIFEERFNLEYSRVENEIPEVLNNLSYHALLGVKTKVLREPTGVRLSELDEMFREDVKPMNLIGVRNKMQAYHAYRWNTGLLVEVDEKISFGELVIASLGGDAYTGHHVVLRIGNNTSGRVILLDYAGPSMGLKTLMVEGIIGEKANIDLDIIALHSRSHTVYNLTHIVLGNESNVMSRVLSLGGAMSRVQVDYIVEGERAKLSALVSAVAREDTRSDVILNSVNKGSESEVIINARGAVLERGYLALRGSAVIGKEAKQASSEIEIQVIIMGDNAKGYAVPILEIHSGDVAKANHAAGISHILEEHRFYLKSRGLSEVDSLKLLIMGILEFSGLVDSLKLNPLRIVAI